MERAGADSARTNCPCTFLQRFRRFGVVMLCASILMSCASHVESLAGINEIDPAELAYLRGMDQLNRANYLEAIGHFQSVDQLPLDPNRAIQGLPAWRTLAALRVGDALFFQGKYPESAQHYAAFIAANQGDPNLDYAQYMLARSYNEQIPADWFLVPPIYENDRQSMQRGFEAMTVFVRQYPRSRYLSDVLEMRERIEALQYEYNSYLVDYYESRDQPAGVLVRLEHMFVEFPERAHTEANYLLLAKAYVQTDQAERAYNTYREFLTRFPESSARSTAEGGVKELEAIVPVKEKPPADVNSEPETPVDPSEPN